MTIVDDCGAVWHLFIYKYTMYSILSKKCPHKKDLCYIRSLMIVILSIWFCYKMMIVEDFFIWWLIPKKCKIPITANPCDAQRLCTLTIVENGQSTIVDQRSSSKRRQNVDVSSMIGKKWLNCFVIYLCKINRKIYTIVDVFFQTSYTHLKKSTI